GLGVRSEDYRLLQGRELIESYDAPILRRPPPYRVFFCRRCGSPVPDPAPTGRFEIPAGVLDGDPGLRPDKHIFVELRTWFEITDRLPRLTAPQLRDFRQGRASLPPVEAWRVAPVLVVRSAVDSVAYYRDKLGFAVLGTFGEPME